MESRNSKCTTVGCCRLGMLRPHAFVFESFIMHPCTRILPLLLIVAFAACTGDNAAPAADAPIASATGVDHGDTLLQIGDVSIRASAVQTSTLNEGVAREYGIDRDPGSVLLLVAVRQGDDASAVAMPATVTASATDLRGSRQVIAMHELRSGGPGSGPGQALVDYVGTVATTLPDTLRFDVRVVRAGGEVSTLRFNREFYPQ